MSDGWDAAALCRREDADPELWFPAGYTKAPDIVQVEDARAACGRCPVLAECLAYVMRSEGGQQASGRHGVWAGLTPKERYELYRGRRKAVAA